MIDPDRGVYGICPPYEVRGFESYTARGTIHIARALYEGRLKLSKRLAEHIYAKCLLCKNCQVHCGSEVDIMSVMKALRQDIFRAGLLPEALKERDASVRAKHNVFSESPAKQGSLIEDLNLPSKGKTLYFAGCYNTYRYPETSKATIAILKQAGMDVAYLGEDEWCCGLPEFHDGNIVLAEENAVHNVNAIKASGAELVITACPGCYTALKSEYPKIVGNLPYKVVHISEVITKLLDAGKIKLSKTINKKLTYHDPCHLGRYEGIYEQPRKPLRLIKGVELVEMRKNRKNAWCCGAGTEVFILDPDLTATIAQTRVKEAVETGTDTIITACPQCVNTLTPAAKRVKMEVVDLPIIVAKAMGLKIDE